MTPPAGNPASLSLRLKEAIASLGRGGKRDIARRCNVSDQAVTGWIKTGSITKDNLLVVSQMTGYSMHWLLTGVGSKKGGDFALATGSLKPDENTQFCRFISIIGDCLFTDKTEWSTMMPIDTSFGFVAFPSQDPSAYAIRCLGDKMRPRIQDGECVAIEPNAKINSGDEVFISSIDGKFMIRKYLYERDDKVYVISVNEELPPESIPRNRIKAIHFIAAIIKRAQWLKQ